MGNKCWQPKATPVIECIQELQRVEKTLQNLIDKYSKQIQDQTRMARVKMYNKPDAMQHIRTIQIIRLHKQRMVDRLTNCIAKRYQLESLNVTKMHIEAVKNTSSTFRQFLQQNDVDRVSRLQDTLAEMIDDACEINDVLQQPLGSDDIDEDELEGEYEALCNEIQIPNMPEAPSGKISETKRLLQSETEFEVIPLH
jgi:charged multivesicular body protein 4|tara:strand:- start:279 stop:869 length:591 start_codon:yes stop_codon:yes gene_type:complete